MKLRLSIAGKIALGFSLFLVAVIVLFYLTNSTLKRSQRINEKIGLELQPSLRSMEALQQDVTRSQMLLSKWLYVQSREDDPGKIALLDLQTRAIPAELKALDSLSGTWSNDKKAKFKQLKNQINKLLMIYKRVEKELDSFSAYTDPLKSMALEPLFDSQGQGTLLSNQIQIEITALIDMHRVTIQDETASMNASIDRISFYTVNISWVVCLLGLIIALFTIRSIRRPLLALKNSILYLGRGMTPKKEVMVTNDEIGDMAKAVQNLVEGHSRTKAFSTELGSGNFEANYKPLSESDELGFALLKMRDSLAQNERTLELKVEQRTNEVILQKEILEQQKEQVSALYKDLTSSINYAKRIQQTILPSLGERSDILHDNFVLFKPKDIVSGDFYWVKKFGSKRYWAAVDCTGHGVPGAFMSFMGYHLLNQAMKYQEQPGDILNELHRLSKLTMRKSSQEGQSLNDGMDMSLCCLNEATGLLTAASANNPIFIIRDKEIHELGPTKMSIGEKRDNAPKFETYSFHTQPGDQVYLFTDGFSDQFGGEKGKKYMKRNFRHLLLEHCELALEEQLRELTSALVRWKGSYEQVDDILVICCKID